MSKKRQANSPIVGRDKERKEERLEQPRAVILKPNLVVN
jgi:hypothetical protein